MVEANNPSQSQDSVRDDDYSRPLFNRRAFAETPETLSASRHAFILIQESAIMNTHNH